MPHLASKEHCTGCTACASVCPKGCISMASDSAGFLFPVVDETACVQCGLCQQSCPVVTPLAVGKQLPEAYAAYTRDEDIRTESSSGGVFSELAKEVLSKGGAVYGAAYGESFEVEHICVEDESSLHRLRGSKYAQSSLGSTFPELKRRLENGQMVLFSGTPCQVGGLKSYLRKEYDNLLTVDFICHGVPSPAAWQQYINYQMQLDGKQVRPAAINMRSKHTGWSRYSYSHQFIYPDGTATAVGSGKSLYMKLFVGDYMSRPSCEKCLFKGYTRISDLTLGDFWGIWNIAPEMDDNKGTSLILCHSTRGSALLNQISDRLVLQSVTPEEGSRENSSLLRSSPAHPRRTEALTAILQGDYSVLSGWFAPRQLTPWQKLRHKIRRLKKRFLK